LILRRGLEGVSVRTVAAEAGLSMGSLRYYFATQADVLTFAMQLVIDRVRDRVQALDPQPDTTTTVLRTVEELLPLDDDRRAEAEVWLAFTVRAQTEPTLRALRDTSYELLQELCRRLVAALPRPTRAAALDLDAEAERLYALIDGLVLHGIVRPDRATPSLMLDVVTGHLAQLTGSGAEQ
jgi:AcrR family transcriptional regulator